MFFNVPSRKHSAAYIQMVQTKIRSHEDYQHQLAEALEKQDPSSPQSKGLLSAWLDAELRVNALKQCIERPDGKR